MITKEVALSLHHGHILYHKTLKNKDGSALRARVNGRCKTWKREPERFELPMKRGLYDCFYITNKGVQQGSEWTTVDPVEMAEFTADLIRRGEKRRAERKAIYRKRYGLADDCPDCVLRDRMIDAGIPEKLADIVCR